MQGEGGRRGTPNPSPSSPTPHTPPACPAPRRRPPAAPKTSRTASAPLQPRRRGRGCGGSSSCCGSRCMPEQQATYTWVGDREGSPLVWQPLGLTARRAGRAGRGVRVGWRIAPESASFLLLWPCTFWMAAALNSACAAWHSAVRRSQRMQHTRHCDVAGCTEHDAEVNQALRRAPCCPGARLMHLLLTRAASPPVASPPVQAASACCSRSHSSITGSSLERTAAGDTR